MDNANPADKSGAGELALTDSRAERVLGHLQHVIGSAATLVDDGRLPECFVFHCDEDAFAGLEVRPGPLVLGLCRRVLHNVQDDVDAFQAIFHVLAHKAATIRSPDARTTNALATAVNMSDGEEFARQSSSC